MTEERKPLCGICGHPMPEGEEMFNHHGYSGPCPEPATPISRSKTEIVAEYIHRDMKNGEFWLDIRVNREGYANIGPFATAAERQRAMDDLLTMMRAGGARDVTPQ